MKKQSLEQYHTSVHPTEHSSEAAENSAVVSAPLSILCSTGDILQWSVLPLHSM